MCGSVSSLRSVSGERFGDEQCICCDRKRHSGECNAPKAECAQYLPRLGSRVEPRFASCEVVPITLREHGIGRSLQLELCMPILHEMSTASDEGDRDPRLRNLRVNKRRQSVKKSPNAKPWVPVP